MNDYLNDGFNVVTSEIPRGSIDAFDQEFRDILLFLENDFHLLISLQRQPTLSLSLSTKLLVRTSLFLTNITAGVLTTLYFSIQILDLICHMIVDNLNILLVSQILYLLVNYSKLLRVAFVSSKE